MGIQVLVTDHHLPGPQPCPADAVVNPNQTDCTFPSRALCGCGVAFYVLLRLRQRMAAQGTDQPLPNLAQYLDWVALATVADLVPLDHNNRILVEHGLQRMRAGHASLGVQALLDISGRDPRRLQSQDLAFAVAPRLNAAGRMEDMTLGVQCLLADTPQLAAQYAAELDRCNQSRRHRQADMLQQAAHQIATLQALHKPSAPQRIRVLWHADWHEGIVGLIAGQLKERFQQPVVALGPGQDGLYKGSARSIAGVHIRDLLAWVDAQYPDILQKFGGHAMAAGLTLAESKLGEFEQALAAAAESCVPPEQWQSVQWVDGALSPQLLSFYEAEQLERLGPWGQACPMPTFINCFEIRAQQWLKGEHLRLTLGFPGQPQSWSGIWFFCPLDPATPLHHQATFIYELQVNRFRDTQQLQLRILQQVVSDSDALAPILREPLQ
jgi:single-stranded-DNA-specific exonuclease